MTTEKAKARKEAQERNLLAALDETGGNVAAAAVLAHMSESTAFRVRDRIKVKQKRQDAFGDEPREGVLAGIIGGATVTLTWTDPVILIAPKRRRLKA